MTKSPFLIMVENARTDIEKEECILTYRRHSQEWRATHTPDPIDHRCEDCMACFSMFSDGERLQDVFVRMIKEGKITCQRD